MFNVRTIFRGGESTILRNLVNFKRILNFPRGHFITSLGILFLKKSIALLAKLSFLVNDYDMEIYCKRELRERSSPENTLGK